ASGRRLLAGMVVFGDGVLWLALDGRLLAELVHELRRVHRGHVPVEEDEGWRRIRAQIDEGLAAARSLDDVVALVLKRVNDRLPHVGVVVDDEDRTFRIAWRHPPLSPAMATGR